MELLLFINNLYLIFQQPTSGSVFIGTFFFCSEFVSRVMLKDLKQAFK